MRSSLALATVLALAWPMPASAQMCGAGQTTGSTASTSAPATGGGMMCGMMGRAASTGSDQLASDQLAKEQRRPMCPMMAMMQGGGMGGMMDSGSAGGMGGMQPSTPQAAPQDPGTGEPPQTPRPQ